MNSSSINNMLTIVAPTPTTPVVPTVDPKEFDRYLQKAAAPAISAEKPAPKYELEASQSEPASERETVESSDQEQTVESSDQEQAESSEDHSDAENTTNEQPAASDKQPASEQPDDDQDEVVLSEAAVALHAEKPTQKEVSTENGEVKYDSTSSDQKPKQTDSKTTVKSEAFVSHSGGEQEEDADLKQTKAEKPQGAKGKSHVSQEQVPESQTENKTEQSGRNSSNRSRESSTSTTPSEEARIEGDSGEQSEPMQEVLPQVEKSKPEIGTTIQSLKPVVSDATESSPTTANSNSSAATTAQNTTSASVVELVPTANQHRTETSSSPVGSETAVPTSDRGRFVQRVANAFRSAQQNDGEIQLRLSPPELGSLKIEIAVRHGVLTAKLEAETVDARNTLLDNLPALRQRLAEQDIRIEKFDVDIRRDGGQGQSGAEDRQSRDGSGRGSMTQRNRRNEDPEVIPARGLRSIVNSIADSLDVRI